jgi:hypothetical protein
MAFVLVQEQPDMFTVEQYDAVTARMNVHEDPPKGLIAHTAGQSDDGKWRIVDIWESEEAYKRFGDERLTPAIREVLEENGIDPDSVPSPEATTFETYDVMPASSQWGG